MRPFAERRTSITVMVHLDMAIRHGFLTPSGLGWHGTNSSPRRDRPLLPSTRSSRQAHARLGGLRRRSNNGEDLGLFEERSALPTRSHAGCTVRPLQVHASPARPGRVQVGSGTDPRFRHLRRVHSSRRYRRLTLRTAGNSTPPLRRCPESRPPSPARPLPTMTYVFGVRSRPEEPGSQPAPRSAAPARERAPAAPRRS
jgi:hypothetical protein